MKIHEPDREDTKEELEDNCHLRKSFVSSSHGPAKGCAEDSRPGKRRLMWEVACSTGSDGDGGEGAPAPRRAHDV